MKEQGYLYIAGGNQTYMQEAVISAQSLRRVDPNAHITLITDKEAQSDIFNQIVIRSRGDFSSWKSGLAYKVEHMYVDSPYEKTLFLDSDTYFYENCEAIFDLLDHYDIGVAGALVDQGILEVNGKVLTVYTPYNTGVIAYRKNACNEQLFKEWKAAYAHKLEAVKLGTTRGNDQASFMEALLRVESRVYVFSNLWNARIPKCIALKGNVKIVHGRHDDYKALGAKLNATSEERFWNPHREKCIVPSKENLFYKLLGKRRSKDVKRTHRKTKPSLPEKCN
jgi:hypothetical protein